LTHTANYQGDLFARDNLTNLAHVLGDLFADDNLTHAAGSQALRAGRIEASAVSRGNGAEGGSWQPRGENAKGRVWGAGPWRGAACYGPPAQNFLQNCTQRKAILYSTHLTVNNPHVTLARMFRSFPLTERTLRATEANLTRLYDAARHGLKGEALAYAADMTPTELRRLQELDPLTNHAIEKGGADAELEMARTVVEAARAGDAKAAMDFLKHRRDWVAKQQLDVSINQQISITAALEQANDRIRTIEHAEADLLGAGRADADGPAVESGYRGRPRAIRDVRVPVGAAEHAAGEVQGPA